MMKNKKFLLIYIVLTVLPIIMSIAAMFFMPDEVPVHYGPSGAVDRWGSKYELMILPVFSVFIAVLMWFSSSISSKNESGTKNNERISLIVGALLLVIFLIFSVFFLYLAFKGAESIYDAPVDIGRLICGLFGVFFVISGNIMPKVKPNSIMGMRTKWSMKNDNIWKKQQRVSGILLIIAGVVLIILAFIFKGMTAVVAMIAVVALMSIIGTVYSYLSAKNDKE